MDILRTPKQYNQSIEGEQGFTLIEMMISMVMGLVLIAGISAIFISDSNISRVISSQTERMGDLFLTSHLMQAALRESQAVPNATTTVLTNLTNRGVSLPAGYPASDTIFTALPFWDATSQTLTYQDMEGNVGIFQYQRIKNDRIYWLRPASSIQRFEELIRDLHSSSGMLVYDPATNNLVTTSLGGGMRIDLKSTYMNQSKQNSTLSLSLLAWPRN